MPKNNLRKLREKAGLTQRELAAQARTSQQQIQRIETGTRIARLDLAMRLCAALNAKPENIFPAAQLPLARYRKSIEEKGDYWPEQSIGEAGSAGLDIDPRIWFFRIGLRNGYQADLRIDGPDRQRLLRAVQTSNEGFLVFDSGQHRYAVNVGYLDFCHFLFEGIVQETDNVSEEATAEIYFANRPQPTVLELDIAQSGGSDRDYDNEVPNKLEELFMSLDSANDSNDFDGMLGIEDEDGEYAFFRPSSVAMLKVSLLAIEPSVVEATFPKQR